ncbi:MAG: hypothetical protein U0Q22_05635 [Acidimicrobiales bacterium]
MASKLVFSSSWWGQAWLDALERSARLDPSRLGRGRSYARRGAVGALMVEPGRVRATVTGSYGRYYTTDVAVRTIPAAAWERVADALAAKSAHSAALADGELDPAIVDDVRSAGVELLPGPGDLRPHCTCPDWAEPCKHASAVCYLVAAELDRDPFLLFLLRGIDRDELVAMVRSRRRGTPAATDGSGALGVPAAAAWGDRELGESEVAPPIAMPAALASTAAAPAHPGRPLPWEAHVTEGDRIDPRRVDELAVDATERAWLLLVDGQPSGLVGSVRGDLARRAVAAGRVDLTNLATRSRLSVPTLQAWAEAWRLGGDTGVDVVADEDSWSIDQVRLAAGRDQLVELGVPKRSVALNYDSLGMPKGVRVVIGPDGLWYRLQSRPGARGTRDTLHLAAAPSDDIADVVELPAT